MHAKLTLLEVRKTVFDDALALEMTVGKETWEHNTNLDIVRLSAASQVPCRLGLNRGASSHRVVNCNGYKR